MALDRTDCLPTRSAPEPQAGEPFAHVGRTRTRRPHPAVSIRSVGAQGEHELLHHVMRSRQNREAGCGLRTPQTKLTGTNVALPLAAEA